MRVGQGFDVHALVAGRPLIIGGVTIPFGKGLLGHSDADAVAHALTDAILGARKRMHTVIAADCSGCELCVPACPVDCIRMVPAPEPATARAPHFRRLYERRAARLARADGR